MQTRITLRLAKPRLTLTQHLQRRFGFVVTCDEYRGVHYTWTYREALEWVACYPWATITRGLSLAASRG